MTMTFKSILIAAALAVTGTIASAATVPVNLAETIDRGDFYTFSRNVDRRTTLNYQFTASRDLRVLDTISAAATGLPQAINVMKVGLDMGSAPSLSNFQTINSNGATRAGESKFAGFVLRQGEMFTFAFENDSNRRVSTALSIVTAAVPVPAAGLMMLTLLAGGAAVAARRKTKQSA